MENYEKTFKTASRHDRRALRVELKRNAAYSHRYLFIPCSFWPSARGASGARPTPPPVIPELFRIRSHSELEAIPNW